MILLDNIEQGTAEWHKARSGIPSASEFGRIITPSGEPSRQADDYMSKLLAEWATNQVEDTFQSKAMKAGTGNEDKARQAYEFYRDVEVSECGFVYKDYRKLVGCSPDGLVGLVQDQTDRSYRAKHGLEIKCPTGGVHVSYVMAGHLPDVYIPQVQGSMYVCGLDRWDFCSWHSKMNPMIITVERDDWYQRRLDELMNEFIDAMLLARDKLSFVLGV